MSLRFPLVFLDRLRMATDGTGVTALVGAYGCPLACRMCINPKTWKAETPFAWLTPEELYDRVKQDSLYYLATGGGVTFGGGEPLNHADFIAAFRAIVPQAWHLYAETSLYVPAEQVAVAAGCIDHFYVDIKDTNPDIYRAYTGHDNTLPMENLTRLLALTGPDRVTVRVPRIPGFNTAEDTDASVRRLEKMGVGQIDRFVYRDPDRRKG